MDNGVMRSLTETYELMEAVTPFDVKTWFKSKGVIGEVQRTGSSIRFYMRSSDNIIPNSIRKLALRIVSPNAQPENNKDIRYGKISKSSITLQTGQWKQLIGE